MNVSAGFFFKIILVKCYNKFFPGDAVPSATVTNPSVYDAVPFGWHYDRANVTVTSATGKKKERKDGKILDSNYFEKVQGRQVSDGKADDTVPSRQVIVAAELAYCMFILFTARCST